MNKPQDDGMPPDVHEAFGPHELLTVEHLIRVARFPIYGFIDHPNGITLHGFGYSTAESQSGQFGIPWQPNQPQFLWQVALHYGYLPEHQRTDQRIELFTTDINHSPISVSTVEDLRRAHEARYSSTHEVPSVAEHATSYLIECFPFTDGTAVATVEYSPHPPIKGHLIGTQTHHVPDSPSSKSPTPRPTKVAAPSLATPVWSFTLLGPKMWVGGRAYGWTQNELFAALEQLAMVSHRPEVLTQYQSEVTAWERHLRSNPSSA